MCLDLDLKDFKVTDAKIEKPDVDSLLTQFRDLGFKRLLRKYGEEVKEVKKGRRGGVTPPVREVKKISDLGDELVVAIDVGQQDLFGGSIREIVLFDGKQSFVAKQPSKEDLKSILDKIKSSKLLIGHDLKSIFHALDISDSKFQIPDSPFRMSFSAYLHVLRGESVNALFFLLDSDS